MLLRESRRWARRAARSSHKLILSSRLLLKLTLASITLLVFKLGANKQAEQLGRRRDDEEYKYKSPVGHALHLPTKPVLLDDTLVADMQAVAATVKNTRSWTV